MLDADGSDGGILTSCRDAVVDVGSRTQFPTDLGRIVKRPVLEYAEGDLVGEGGRPGDRRRCGIEGTTESLVRPVGVELSSASAGAGHPSAVERHRVADAAAERHTPPCVSLIEIWMSAVRNFLRRLVGPELGVDLRGARRPSHGADCRNERRNAASANSDRFLVTARAGHSRIWRGLPYPACHWLTGGSPIDRRPGCPVSSRRR